MPRISIRTVQQSRYVHLCHAEKPRSALAELDRHTSTGKADPFGSGVLMKSLKLNVIMNAVRTAASMVFPLITFPYVSRVLGPEGVGKNNFALSLVGYFTLLASIGIPLYGIREVAKTRDDKPALSALVQELLVLHGVASLGSFLAFIGMLFFNRQMRSEPALFLVVSISIPLSMLTMEWLYQGLEDYVYITARSISISALSVVALFVFVHRGGDYVVNAAVTVAASLGSSVLNFWNARKFVFARRDRPWQFRRHFRPLVTIYALNFIISIYVSLDTVMLGFLSTSQNVGYYSSAVKLTKLLIAMVTSFGTVLLPRLSYYLSNDRREDFDRMLRKSLGIVLLLCLPIQTALMLISRELLEVVAGIQYLPASGCVVITAPIILAIGLSNIFGFQILYSMSKEKTFVFSVSVGAVIDVVLNWILIPRFSHFGAAAATLFAEAAITALQIVLVRRFYHVPWPWKNIGKYLLATASMAGALLGIRWIVPESHLWVRLLVDVPLGAVLYFLVLHLLGEEFVGEIVTKVRGRLVHA